MNSMRVIKNFYTKEECLQLRNHPDNVWKSAESRSLSGEISSGSWRNADIANRIPTRQKDVFAEIIRFNLANHDLQLNGKLESNINRYGVGNYFKQHYDMILDDTTYTLKECRKISVSIQLSDPSEYEGGRLIIKGKEAPIEQGDMTIFHSLTSHKVTEVTKGIRYSMNIFAYGEFTL